ncbi:MAG: 50S ribosomal protein L24 [Candidatus Omnitrophota bacterium]|nr:50S ribosomal protein L24 [Candidatus Omnitrophota bacterium]MBU1928749.1 50S ribosomal protein L24 [Candidatus Omnitrophota bacterium]MBU2034204.1 50S ribosomal protein L24 [Candidatus Omnitrophota bacterium]MBU2222177.1 50S ribosomal protein L24 [Candidatus Omnitrophota bacterium]MBU2257970.1 50S ribosomal protein L24 [Candidatus Omnitrophota bacterium]
MLKIKKGDTVQAIKGKDKGKKGKVLNVLAKESRIIVEGINLAKKAMRKTQTNQQGGIVSIERPLHISNVMYFCKGCSRPSRVGFKLLEDKTKVRFCKNCSENIQ